LILLIIDRPPFLTPPPFPHSPSFFCFCFYPTVNALCWLLLFLHGGSYLLMGRAEPQLFLAPSPSVAPFLHAGISFGTNIICPCFAVPKAVLTGTPFSQLPVGFAAIFPFDSPSISNRTLHAVGFLRVVFSFMRVWPPVRRRRSRRPEAVDPHIALFSELPFPINRCRRVSSPPVSRVGVLGGFFFFFSHPLIPAWLS